MLKFDTICSNTNNFNAAVSEIINHLTNIDNLIKVTLFVPDTSIEQLLNSKQIVNSIWNESNPKSEISISLIAQKPLGSNIVAEYISYQGNGCVQHALEENTEIVEIHEGKKRAIFLNDIQGTHTNSFLEQAEKAFYKSDYILKKYNYAYSNIIRQWNYIPDIIDLPSGQQCYQIFNDVRSKYYNAVKWNHGYPAATGIGVAAKLFSIDLIAIDGFNIKTIANPDQVDAHVYSKQVLEQGYQENKTTPKFERAKLLEKDSDSLLFISGTAAIVGENSLETNIENQTKHTLAHIKRLCKIPADMLIKNSSNYDIQLLRAYIKHDSDYLKVEDICKKEYPNASVLCVKADVCRKELLVEIEAFAKQRNID